MLCAVVFPRFVDRSVPASALAQARMRKTDPLANGKDI